MRVAYQNYTDATGVTLIASTEDASYPVANIQDQRLSTRWRTTAITSQSVIVDLGSARAIDTVAILGHNVASAATVTLVGSSELYASAWSDWYMVGSALSVAASGSAAIAALSSTRAAYIDQITEQLQTYAWSGSAWTTLGSALTISGTGVPALAALTASQVAFVDSSNDELRTYSFSGSAWTMVGSALGVTISPPALAALTASQVAFVDLFNDELRTYSWSGSVWTVTGSALAIAGVGTPALAKLTASTVAFSDDANEELRTYSWSGSAWSLVGSGLTITGIGSPSIAALSATYVMVTDPTIGTTRTYSWSGSVWTALGNGLTFAQGVAAVAGLNATDVAFVDVTNDQLRTYRGNTSLTAPETISYDADVMLKFFTSTSRQYWQVLVEGTTTGSYIEMGRVWLGPYMTIDPSSLVDFRVTKKRSDTVIYGKHRQKWADPGYGWRRFDLNFPDTESSMLTQISSMYDTVGNHTSFVFCNFDTERAFELTEPCYVSVQGELQFVNRGRYRMTWAMALEEDR